MAKIKLNVRIEIKREDVEKYLEEQEKTRPCSFYISDTIVETKAYGWDKGYAEFLEYGTGPAHSPDPHDRYWIGAEGEKRLIEWAHRKLGMSKKEAIPFVKQLIFKIYQNGMPPHPFFRPAVYPIFDSIQQLFDEGYSFRDMCETMRLRCIQNLSTAGWGGNDLNDTGNLLGSLKVEYIDKKDTEAILTDKNIQLYADRAWDTAKNRK